MKKIMKSKKGFTLAEMLIVIAIIAVLVAVAIPVFTSALDRAESAAEQANARALHAELISEYLMDGTLSSGATFTDGDGAIYTWTYTDDADSASVTVTGGKANGTYTFPVKLAGTDLTTP